MPFYAVAKTRDGNGVGIYKDWESAKPFCIDNIDNRPFKDVKFKKFETHEEAFQFLRQMQSFFAYFRADGDGAVFDSFELMVAALGGSWKAPGEDIDYVQRSSKASAEQWLLERMKSVKPSSKHKRSSSEMDGVKGEDTTTSGPKRQRLVNHGPETFFDEEEQPPEPSSRGPSMSRGLSTEHHQSESDDTLVVWTDGACISNGQGNRARAGWGVWFGPEDGRNCFGPLPMQNHTNQRAELFAIQRALELTKHDDRLLVVKSDSKYSMQCLIDWLPAWRKNGFMTANKTAVKNRDLIEPIDRLIKQRGESRVKFEHVKAHAGIMGNEAADRLASRGAQQVVVRGHH